MLTNLLISDRGALNNATASTVRSFGMLFERSSNEGKVARVRSISVQLCGNGRDANS